MDDIGYRRYLEGEGLTEKAINSRITRANRVEREFKVNLEHVIQNEETMLDLRSKIYETYGNSGSLPGNLYNAVTKYFYFRNDRPMPRINSR